MRFERLELHSFGVLSGQVFHFGEQATVICGPNEAGKSTLHSALQTAFFGFEESRREKHPLGSWDPTGPALSLSAQLRMEAGASIWLRRELRIASGTLQRSTNQAELENQPRTKDQVLTEIQAISRELFRAVYSLGADGSLELKDNVRHQVDNLLTGDVGLPGTRPFHELQAEIRQSAGQLWRSDGRRTAARLQLQTIQDLRSERRQSAAMDLERRREQRELSDLDQSLQSTRKALRTAREGLTRAQFHTQWQEWKTRKEQCIDLHASALEGEALEDPTRLQQEVDRLQKELQEPQARLNRPALTLDTDLDFLIEHESEIRNARDQQPQAQVDAERHSAAKKQHRDHIEQARRALADVGLSHLDSSQLDHLPLGAWMADARAWQDAQEHARQAQANTATEGLDLVALGLLILGLIFASLFAMQVLPGLALWVGLSLMAAAFWAIWTERRPRRNAQDSANDAPASLEEACAHLDSEPLVSPHRMLRQLEGVADAREAADQASEAELAASECMERIQSRLEIWSSLAHDLLPKQKIGTPDQIPDQLSEALQQALDMREKVRANGVERAAEAVRVEERSARLAAASRRLERARTALEESFGPDMPIEVAFQTWKEQLDLAAFVRAAEQDLKRHPLYGQGEDPRNDGESVATWEQRLRDLEAEEKNQLGLRERLLERSTHRSIRPVAEIDADLVQAEEELASIHLHHDRLMLLDRLLIRAEQNYRREHQPDVLERAGRYLSQVSAGRYTELSYPQGEDGPLHVFSTEQGQDLLVGAPLSRGTQEQIYLALRLGTLDHLDAGRVRLPLILDEILVHWDRDRRRALYPVLGEIALQRQVVLLTCHPEFALEAQEGIGAARIDLKKSE